MDVTDTSRKAWGYCLECEIKGVIVAEFQNISPIFSKSLQNSPAWEIAGNKKGLGKEPSLLIQKDFTFWAQLKLNKWEQVIKNTY